MSTRGRNLMWGGGTPTRCSSNGEMGISVAQLLAPVTSPVRHDWICESGLNYSRRAHRGFALEKAPVSTLYLKQISDAHISQSSKLGGLWEKTATFPLPTHSSQATAGPGLVSHDHAFLSRALGSCWPRQSQIRAGERAPALEWHLD